MKDKIEQAANWIKQAQYVVAFTGAGISVESGIPPFRGDGGLWNQYNPIILDIDYYQQHTEESWKAIKRLFFDFFGKAKPNAAHYALASMEKAGLLKSVITQNIDNLHQEAGSENVIEFHGNCLQFICLKCGATYQSSQLHLSNKPPHCLHPDCRGLLKPDFVFFGEGIPAKAYQASIDAATNADIFILIGTTGEIMPASQIPLLAKENGAKIIEINIEESNFTSSITDLFIKEKAGIALEKLQKELP